MRYMDNPYSFDVYEPMLVGKCPKNYKEILAKKDVIATVKKDGTWQQLIKEKNQVYMFSRSISKKTGFYSEKIDHVPHIGDWAMKNLPNGTAIVGELYFPGGSSRDVTKVMGALVDKAIERQADDDLGKLHFYAHDILKYNGEDYVLSNVDYGHRYSNLCRNIDIMTKHPDFIEIASCYDNAYLDLMAATDKVIANGEEGMVFRIEDGLYAPGKRQPKVMWKIKEHVDSLDFVITDLLDPVYAYDGKTPDTWQYTDDNGNPITKAAFYGWKNAVEISCYDGDELVRIGTVSSGIPDEMKEDMAVNPDRYLGQVCRVGCMSVDASERTLRHPIFLGMHEDKPAKDCKVEDAFSQE